MKKTGILLLIGNSLPHCLQSMSCLSSLKITENRGQVARRLVCAAMMILCFFSLNKPLFAYPKGCEARGFTFISPFIILNESGEQTFYLLQNKSGKTIELQRHETREVFMSPALSVKLNPSRWAAFASDVQNLYFACFVHEKQDVIPVDCGEVLDICQYPRVKFALSNMGNYWVSVNRSQKKVIREAIAKGILLRW